MFLPGRDPRAERTVNVKTREDFSIKSSRVFAVFARLMHRVFYTLNLNISTLLSKGMILVIITLLISGSVLLLGFNTPPTAHAAVAGTSKTLNFQARLLNASGSLVPDGYYNIRFKLYNVSTAGTALWTDTRYDNDGAAPIGSGDDYRLRVVNGYFSVNLGDTAAGGTAFSGIDWSQQLWLTMDIGGSTQTATPTYDGEMTPRIQMAAVPLAFMANNVNSGNTNAASTNSNNVTIQSGNAAGTTSNSGNITLDTGTATGTTGTISLGSTNASSLIFGRAGLTTLNNGALTVAQLLTASGSGTGLAVTNNATVGGALTVAAAGGYYYGSTTDSPLSLELTRTVPTTVNDLPNIETLFPKKDSTSLPAIN